ncbi:hypothetical protein [Pseudomonas sp. UMAB-40]|uniref:hypothetical protein n=1 Tax=Pseudomonas sp. UMAB-40 TaxID=1365407 RepID=UPI001C5899F6|nr:hypothetical protein [Pseudomonas sp. UMAB-40]
MPTTTTLSDFLLHVGPTSDGDRCALLRALGDEWIEQGHVTARPTTDDRFEVMLVTPTQSICLAGVERNHMDLIRGHGLYVIQRQDEASETQAVLMEWREC